MTIAPVLRIVYNVLYQMQPRVGKMVTEIEEKYPKTNEGLRLLMKTVQRELEDGQLKVELLGIFVTAMDILDKERKESSGRE